MNDRKRTGPWKGPPVVTHCKYGHEYSSENTYRLRNGKRFCRRCGTRRTLASRKRGTAA